MEAALLDDVGCQDLVGEMCAGGRQVVSGVQARLRGLLLLQLGGGLARSLKHMSDGTA